MLNSYNYMRLLVAVVLVACVAALASAEAPATPASKENPTAPAPPATPATPAPPAITATQPDKSISADPMASLSPELRELLTLVGEAGEKYRSITADVVYREEETVFGERSTYRGKVYYHKPAGGEDAEHVGEAGNVKKTEKSGSFRIHFDKLIAGGRSTDEDRDYVFYSDKNGQWFVTRNAKIKQIVKYHVARPGGKSDPMELGRGPFPVPFGQDPKRVMEMFDLSTRPHKAGDPADSKYVKLTPHKDTAKQLRVSLVEMWINKEGLPVKIRIDDLDGEVRKTADFRKIDYKSKISEETFKLPWPSVLSGWERRIEPLPETEEK